MTTFGYSASLAISIGLALLVSTILMLVPRTAVLGCILVTGLSGRRDRDASPCAGPVVPISCGSRRALMAWTLPARRACAGPPARAHVALDSRDRRQMARSTSLSTRQRVADERTVREHSARWVPERQATLTKILKTPSVTSRSSRRFKRDTFPADRCCNFSARIILAAIGASPSSAFSVSAISRTEVDPVRAEWPMDSSPRKHPNARWPVILY
jgi:hypothetical protein